MNAQDYATTYFADGHKAEPYNTKQAVDHDGKPLLNSDGTPWIVGAVDVISKFPGSDGMGVVTHVRPSYCATDQMAADLADVLRSQSDKITSVSILQAGPFGDFPASDLYIETGTVPWFEISGYNSDNAVVTEKANAGQLSTGFAQYPPDLALSSLLGDLKGDFDRISTNGGN